MNARGSVPAKGVEPIPFLRERLLALGSLALLAPVPLFFSNALELAVLLVYLGVLAVFLLRVRGGRIPRLGNRALNLAGLLYLPVIVVDVRFGSQTLLKTMLHLLLFTTLFKLAAIRKERDLSLALVLSGMLFVASVSTSFHYAILLYVLLVAFVGWAVLVKWALWRDLAAAPEEWSRDRAARELPGRGPLFTSVLSTVLISVPLFLFLPRLKTPYVKGAEAGREITTGFSENVDPDLFGALKQNERVFLRITSEEPLGEGAAAVLRLRTLALSRWEGGVWKKPLERGVTVAPAGNGVLIPLASRGRAAPGSTAMTIDLTPIQTRTLPYPLLGSALRLSEGSFRNPNLAYVERDAARNVRLPFEPDRTIQYTALYGMRPLPDLEPGDVVEAGRAAGSRALRAFALETLAGIDPAADPEAAARAIEAALQKLGLRAGPQAARPERRRGFRHESTQGPLPDVRDRDGAPPPGSGRPHPVRDRLPRRRDRRVRAIRPRARAERPRLGRGLVRAVERLGHVRSDALRRSAEARARARLAAPAPGDGRAGVLLRPLHPLVRPGRSGRAAAEDPRSGRRRARRPSPRSAGRRACR